MWFYHDSVWTRKGHLSDLWCIFLSTFLILQGIELWTCAVAGEITRGFSMDGLLLRWFADLIHLCLECLLSCFYRSPSEEKAVPHRRPCLKPIEDKTGPNYRRKVACDSNVTLLRAPQSLMNCNRSSLLSSQHG